MSSISCGIVGLPNVGKSTLFNCLTSAGALVANYPFATIDPNVGIVEVGDDRLAVLAKMYDTDRIIPATLNVTDIAGLVSGASTGEGLGNQFLSHIRACQAIVQVVRSFEDDSVTHVDNDHNPKKDIDAVNTELVLSDLQTIDRRLVKLTKEAKAEPKLIAQLEVCKQARQVLDDGKPLNIVAKDWSDLDELQLLTLKPLLFVFNIDETKLSDESYRQALSKLVDPSPSLFICAKLEAQLVGLNDADKNELLKDLGQSESALNQLVHALYDLLDLQSYLTAGKKEVRAWTIKEGSIAPEAAGVIHSDFEKGFIAADVVSYNDLVSAGSLAGARSAGKVRTEGKTYVVRPDDVIEFKFNVS